MFRRNELFFGAIPQSMPHNRDFSKEFLNFILIQTSQIGRHAIYAVGHSSDLRFLATLNSRLSPCIPLTLVRKWEREWEREKEMK